MKKQYLIFAGLFLIPLLLKAEIIYRISESDTKQVTYEILQGGALLRFDFEKIDKIFESKKTSSWKFKEIWISNNTETADIEVFILINIPDRKDKVSDILKNYSKNTMVDEVSNDLLKRIMKLEKGIEKLEKP